MAKGTEGSGEVVPVDTTEADGEAWREAAATRKYRVDGGQVWAFSGGKLFPVPAPQGFAGLGAAIRPLIAQSLLQFVQNRVGQKAGAGVSAVDAAIKAIAEGEVSNAQTNDAFEAAHRHGITTRIEAVKGVLPETATAAEKKERAEMIAATMKARGPDAAKVLSEAARNAITERGESHDLSGLHVEEAKTAGANAGTASEKARKTKAPDASKVADI